MLRMISCFLVGGTFFLSGLAESAFAQSQDGLPSLASLCIKTEEGRLYRRFVEAMKSQDLDRQIKAATAIAKLGPRAKEVTPMLIELAVNSGGSAEVLHALQKIDADATCSAVRQLILDAQTRCKKGARFQNAFVNLGESVAPHLVTLIDHSEVGAEAQSLLIRIGEPAVRHLQLGITKCNRVRNERIQQATDTIEINVINDLLGY